MKRSHIVLLIGCLVVAPIIFYTTVFAQSSGLTNVHYPIKELGNCVDESACKAYCDKADHTNACLDYAKNNNLMSSEEVRVAEKFLAADGMPGGCTTKESCDEYCNNISHIDECVAFAEKNGLLSPKELEESKKVQSAIKRGVKAPQCGNKKSCDTYCEDSSHMEECVNFAIEAGFVQGKEKEDAQKMVQAVKRGVKPLPCKGKESCDLYCSNPGNMEACMTFAAEAGMMSEQEKADSQKMLQALKKGVKPPQCKGKEECDAYCQTDEHIEECINFSVAAGMMDAKDGDMARKTKGKGPGGCRGQEECTAFCSTPANQETCFNFAKENGMLPEEDMNKIQQANQGVQSALSTAPQEVVDCFNFTFGSETVEKMKNGTAQMNPDMSDKMNACFQLGGGNNGPACTSPEECQKMCEENPDKCKGKEVEGKPSQTGPGGCKSPEECDMYCKQHPDECGVHAGPGGCQSEAECKAYCDGHPQECGAPAPGTMMQKCEGSECDSWHAEDQGQ